VAAAAAAGEPPAVAAAARASGVRALQPSKHCCWAANTRERERERSSKYASKSDCNTTSPSWRTKRTAKRSRETLSWLKVLQLLLQLLQLMRLSKSTLLLLQLLVQHQVLRRAQEAGWRRQTRGTTRHSDARDARWRDADRTTGLERARNTAVGRERIACGPKLVLVKDRRAN